MLAWRTLKSGIVRQTIQMSILSVSVSCLVCYAPFFLLTVWWVALDPNWKLVYTEDKWDQDFYEAGIKQFEEVVRNLLHTDSHVLMF
jgi:hypothetical protein